MMSCNSEGRELDASSQLLNLVLLVAGRPVLLDAHAHDSDFRGMSEVSTRLQSRRSGSLGRTFGGRSVANGSLLSLVIKG